MYGYAAGTANRTYGLRVFFRRPFNVGTVKRYAVTVRNGSGKHQAV